MALQSPLSITTKVIALLNSIQTLKMIVDDDQTMHWAMAESMYGWEYVTVKAAPVAVALTAFNAERPSAVLLDIDLPDGSDLDALREIENL